MNLDSLDQMKELDKEGVYLSISALPDQMKSARDAISSIELPPEFKLAQNVVLSGMGGSALAGKAIKSLFSSHLRIPFEVRTNYGLPGYVNENTIVILSSYSGNTEETLTAAKEAKEKEALVFGITTGGKLKEFLLENEYPHYLIDTKHNPSGQPRMSLGYTVLALMLFLNKCSVFSLTDLEVNQAIESAEKFVNEFSAREPKDGNQAKLFANKLQNKMPVMVSSSHLIGLTHAVKNQFNENSKTFALHFPIPELNHHLMEGLKYPQAAKSLIHFVFFESDLYADHVKKRYPITQEVVEKQGYEFSVYKLQSETKTEQVVELLVLGSYVSFYIAMLHGFDPAPIPWVDYFKDKLA